MVPVSDFLSRLLPNVIGCPEPLATQALVDAAIAFCEQSLAIQVDLDPQPLLANIPQYDFDLPTQTRLGQVIRVWANDRLLPPTPRVQVIESAPRSGSPRYYYTQDVDEQLVLTLYPTPDETVVNGLEVRVATVPTRTATQVHSALFNEWSDVIVDAALARLYGTPGQVFSNEAKGVFLAQRARAKTNEARVEALRGRAVSSLSVTMRGF